MRVGVLRFSSPSLSFSVLPFPRISCPSPFPPLSPLLYFPFLPPHCLSSPLFLDLQPQPLVSLSVLLSSLPLQLKSGSHWLSPTPPHPASLCVCVCARVRVCTRVHMHPTNPSLLAQDLPVSVHPLGTDDSQICISSPDLSP